MRELAIHHLTARPGSPTQVRIAFRSEPGAQPQEVVKDFPFSLGDGDRQRLRWYVEEYLDFPYGPFCDRAREVEQRMEQTGAELFKAVFGGTAALLYARAADRLAETKVVVHADSQEGLALPWELLRDPARGDYGGLARLAYAFVRSRHDPAFALPEMPRAEPTFNVLLVISRPAGLADVPFQSVARPLLELVRPHRDRIHIDVLRPPTLKRLADVLGRRPGHYHVVHFDGHGSFSNDASTEQGRLLFEDEDGAPHPVTGSELGGVLAGKGVPVVLLNACRSGMTHPGATYPAVADQLLRAGVRAVLAMAYAVRIGTVVRFLARLYEGLLGGEELAHAAAQAREQLRVEPMRPSPRGPMPLMDWLVPVLLEAGPVRLDPAPAAGLRLDASFLRGDQRQGGEEVGCPDPPAYGLVGRDNVIHELERAFRHEDVVLLEGMAGAGKTEAAVGFARWQAETGAMGGPVFFFSFERRLPVERVIDRVGEALRETIRQQTGVEWQRLNEAERRTAAVHLLRHVSCLLIWDNFEPVAGCPAGTDSEWAEEERQELREFLTALRGGRAKVLLTSRRDESWLGSVYRRVGVEGLPLKEAHELALRVLRRAGLDAAQIHALPPYRDLLKYLRGNPLAIQSVLPELRRQAPDELLAALQAGEAQLPDDEVSQGRERSLAASLSFRMDRLDPSIARRLCLLALFQGTADACVLAATCADDRLPDGLRGTTSADWVRCLEVGAEIGWLRRAGDERYVIHPVLPWFLRGRLRQEFGGSEPAMEAAYTAACGAAGSSLAKGFLTNPARTLLLLESEEANLSHALRLARRDGRWDAAEGALRGLNYLFTTRGRWAEWGRLLRQVEWQVTGNGQQLDERPDAGTLWVAILGFRSYLASFQLDFQTQRLVLALLRACYEENGDKHNLAVTYLQLGTIELHCRQFDAAEEWFTKCLRLYEEVGNGLSQAMTLHQLGMVAHDRGDLEGAKSYYRRAEATNRRHGAETMLCRNLHQLACLSRDQADLAGAERLDVECLEIGERIGDLASQSMSLLGLGVTYELANLLDQAERRCRRGLALATKMGDQDTMSRLYHQLGQIALRRRDYQEARRWYEGCFKIADAREDEHTQAYALHQLGRVAEDEGDLTQAEGLFRRAEGLIDRINDAGMAEGIRKSLRRIWAAPKPG